MSAATVSAAVGEDGINIAVEALKEVAALGTYAERIEAAQALLHYGLETIDAFGNVVRG